MYTLDANVVARDLDPGDGEYAACHELIAQFDRQAIAVIVPRLLLAEVAGLARRLTRDPIRARLVVDAWRTFTHVRIVSLDDALIDTAAEIAADYALRGADVIYVAVARQYNCTLVSLDRLALVSAPGRLSPPARPLRRSRSFRHRRKSHA